VLGATPDLTCTFPGRFSVLLGPNNAGNPLASCERFVPVSRPMCAGTILAPSGEGPDGLTVHAPCVVQLHDGSLRMWYSGLAAGDTDLAYRICTARFPGP
jgi:hypothetical protein